jgi:Uncharacterized conserved protein
LNKRKEHQKVFLFKERSEIIDHDNEVRKLRRELDQARYEIEELIQTTNDLKNQLANERQNAELSTRREKDIKERNDRLATELEKAQIRLQNIEAQHARSLENTKNDFQARIAKYEQMIEK